MKLNRVSLGISLLMVMLVGGLFFTDGSYAETPRVVTIEEVTGEVYYLKGENRDWAALQRGEERLYESDWIPLKAGMKLAESDWIRTRKHSKARIFIRGLSDARATLGENADMQISVLLRGVWKKEPVDDTELALGIGSVLVEAEKLEGESRFEVRNPNSIVGIRGTIFEVKVRYL